MTEASELEFVEIIREFPVLYDKKHPKYLNNQHKAVIWTQIAEKANLTGNKLENDKCLKKLIKFVDAKAAGAKWRRIKSKYSKYKAPNPTGDDGENDDPEKGTFLEAMSFLETYTAPRPRLQFTIYVALPLYEPYIPAPTNFFLVTPL